MQFACQTTNDGHSLIKLRVKESMLLSGRKGGTPKSAFDVEDPFLRIFTLSPKISSISIIFQSTLFSPYLLTLLTASIICDLIPVYLSIAFRITQRHWHKTPHHYPYQLIRPQHKQKYTQLLLLHLQLMYTTGTVIPSLMTGCVSF